MEEARQIAIVLIAAYCVFGVAVGVIHLYGETWNIRHNAWQWIKRKIGKKRKV